MFIKIRKRVQKMTNPNMTLAELATAIFKELNKFDDIFEQLPQLVAGIFQQRNDAKEMRVTPTVNSATSAKISFVLVDTNDNMGATSLGLEWKEDGIYFYHSGHLLEPKLLNTPDDLAKAAIVVYEDATTELNKEQKNRVPKKTFDFT